MILCSHGNARVGPFVVLADSCHVGPNETAREGKTGASGVSALSVVSRTVAERRFQRRNDRFVHASCCVRARVLKDEKTITGV